MGGLFRKICAYLCKPIYLLIVYMYKIFYNIATTRFLNSDIIQQFSANIYTLVSVVMLFAFSITILSAIVNPDLLSDNKKGVKALFKRAIIALVLMVVIPFAFDELYAIQENVMSNSLIEKIVVGISYDCEGSDDTNCAGGNGGQVISGTLISSVIRPEEKYMSSDGSISIDKTTADAYKKMVSEDISYIGIVAKNINVTVDDVDGKDVTDDDAYAFHFDELIAIAAGIATIYILVLFSIDVAVRVFKLAFLELTAPISIVSYVAAGDKILSSWFKELGKTYAELFVRVAAIAFYLFLIKNLNSLMENFTSADWSFVLKAFIMIGMLIFAKQVPDLIGKIFGVEMKSQGGIAGRLGSMAGVGNVAKKAWEAVRNPIAAAAGVGSMALGTGAHIASAIRTSAKNGSAAVKRIRADKRGFTGIRAAGAMVSAIGSGVWGSSVGSVSAAARSLKNGVNNKNLHSMKDEYDLYKDTHKEGSTAVGRAIDDIRLGTGFKSRADSRSDKNEKLAKVQESINAATTVAENFLAREDSDRIVLTTTDEKGNRVAMNLHQATEFISTLRKNAPVRKDGEDYDAFQKRIANHMNKVNTLEEQLRNSKQSEIEQIMSSANNGSLTGEGGIEASYEINNHLNDARKAVKDSKVSGVNIGVNDLGSASSVHDNIYEKNTGALDVVAEEITLQNEIKDKNGNLTHYGRQKADSDSINNRPGNKSSSSSSGKDSGSSK